MWKKKHHFFLSAQKLLLFWGTHTSMLFILYLLFSKYIPYYAHIEITRNCWVLSEWYKFSLHGQCKLSSTEAYGFVLINSYKLNTVYNILPMLSKRGLMRLPGKWLDLHIFLQMFWIKLLNLMHKVYSSILFFRKIIFFF